MKTGKLRLGPMPNQETTKLTISLPVPHREELEDYARVYAQTFGQTVDLASLIPHMLRVFMARDRAFQRMRTNSKRKSSSADCGGAVG
jgi:hypothetical protein